jgi:glycosyltransferase involved in cell wall biosynthesis
MILKFSGFLSNPWGHGGEKRAHQIDCVLLKNGFDVDGNLIDVAGQSAGLRKKEKLKRIMQGFDIVRRYLGYRRAREMAGDWRYLLEIGHFKASLMRQSEQEPFLVLWESTISRFWYVPYIANELGVRIVALPQNLESMVPGQKSKISGNFSPYWLNEEVEALRICAKVYCISRYDQWLLHIFGIDADFFPYYPDTEILSFFTGIRKKRESNTNPAVTLVLLGTVHNRPTLEGMKNIIDFLEQRKYEFAIAGYGTEELRDYISYPERSTILGSIDKEGLAKLLSSATHVLINQSYSSGCLTRIMELLIAGIPVVANPAGARNYENLDGVYIYNNLYELEGLLGSTLPIPSVPLRQDDDEKRFIELVGSKLRM